MLTVVLLIRVTPVCRPMLVPQQAPLEPLMMSVVDQH